MKQTPVLTEKEAELEYLHSRKKSLETKFFTAKRIGSEKLARHLGHEYSRIEILIEEMTN